MVRWLVVPLFTTIVVLARGPSAVALDDSGIADAIAGLSDRDVAVRERASTSLLLAGRAAEPALRAATGSDDPEVARRAQGILLRFQLGLYPDTPVQVLDAVQNYRNGDAAARQAAIAELASQGNRGLRVLVGLRRGERDDVWRGAILKAIGQRPYERQGAAMMLAEGDPPAALQLMQAAAQEGETSTRDWASLMLLYGGLDDQIAAATAEARNSPDGRAATRLAYLARARGDLARAANAADQADDPHLIDSVLIEAGDWKRLAMRYRERVGSSSDTFGFAMAFYRLAGQKDGVESAAASLRTFADRHDEEYWNCAECLMLNDRVDEGVAILLSHKNYAAAVDFLLPRLQFKEVLALPAHAKDELKPPDLLQLKAKLLAAHRFIGNQAATQQALAELLNESERQKDFDTYRLVNDAFRQFGKTDQADELFVRAMAMPAPDNGRAVLDRTAMPDGFASWFWWRVLRMHHLAEPYIETLRRLRAFAAGQLPVDQCDAICEDARKGAMAQTSADQEEALRTIGQTLNRLHRAEAAEHIYRTLVELFPNYSSWQSIGDCEAARGDFVAAARSYEQAWDFDRTRAVPLALRGWALLKVGDSKEGRAAIELAHALPLADERQRTALADVFRNHALDDDAHRERELILKTGTFLSWDVCNANRAAGDDALARGDYLVAAEFWEKAFLGNLQSNTSFLEPWANVMIPVMIHRARALGLMKQSPAEAFHEARTAMSESPGDANTLIDLVLGFEQAGHRAEADALFAPICATYSRLCEDFPSSGSAHNELAWIEGRCHRNLDDALKHGVKAIELDPNNTADLDTLAEVYFARGQFEAALATMERCVELEPNVAHHREQIERFRAAMKRK